MVLSTRDIELIFRKFQVAKKKSTHHVRGFVVINGRKVLPVHYSFGRGDMPGHVSEKFRKSLKLSKEDLSEALACRFGFDDYVEALRRQGVVP